MKEYKRNCCAKRSILEKILIVVIVLLLCLLIALFSVLVLHLQNGKRDNSLRFKAVSSTSSGQKQAAFSTPGAITRHNEAGVCMTHQCVQAASQIIDFIDPSIEPCDDFYGFVCGAFLNKSTENNQITPLYKFESITLSRVDALITEPIDEPLPKSLELQRKFYKLCMDTNAIENDDTATFSNLIKNLGDWPAVYGRFWNEVKFNWMNAMIECRKLGFGYEQFLGISASDSNGTGLVLLTITPPAVISLPYQLRELYIDVMANISIELKVPSYLAKTEFIRVFKFEEELRAFAQDEGENGQEEILSVGKLQEDFPSIPWEYFLNEITRNPSFTGNTLVRLRARRFLTNLLSLLDRTQKSIQANYVIWKIIENFRSYLKESVRSLYERFLVTLNPNYAFMTNRHVYCLDKAKFYFPSVAELAYVRRYLPSSQRKDIKEMTDKIQEELIKKVETNDWMDAASKNVSTRKLSKVEKLIGSSDEAYFGDFDEVVDMDNFQVETDNVMEMATKLYAKRADNYFKIVNTESEDVTKQLIQKAPVLSINAYYNEEFNSLLVPASFLQGVMYNFDRPQYMNYGAVGTVIGHELTHGFVADQNVSEKSGSGWSKDTSEKYNETTQCLLKQYETYAGHLKGFTKNSSSVLEENVADVVGPNLAYQAYQTRVSTHGQEPTLPSLPYTPNQMFWIMSGVFRCYQPKLQQNLRFDQEHAVPSFTVTSIVRNSPAFATDFNCPVGSNMNPENKCQIL